MISSYKTLRKKEYEKVAFKNLQAEAFCDLLEVILPDSKLPKKARELKNAIQTIKHTYPNPDIVEVTKTIKGFKVIFNLIRKVF